MNVEHRLIAKIIRTGNFRAVQKARIIPSMFKAPDARQMFKAIRDYYNDAAHYGRTPSRAWMAERFQSFDYIKSRESIPELAEILRQKAMKRQIANTLEDVSTTLEGEGPYKALSKLRAEVVKAQSMTAPSRDVILAESADALISEYKKVQKSEGLLGVPWPWEKFNIQTQGMLPEEFIVMYGRLKSMKSWLGVKIATHAYEVGNRRVLFYSCEMGPEQVRRRIAATLCGIDYDLLKRAKLPDDQRKEYFNRLRSLKKEEKRASSETHTRSMLITSDKEDPSGGGVGHIIAKADEFQPHLIIADSFYRMRDDRSGRRSMKWEVQAAITQDLKHAAQKLQIPIIGITQKNRSRGEDAEADEGMEDISYTDAAGQEADMGLRVVKKGMTDDGFVILNVYIAGAREIKTDGFRLKVLPSTTWDWEGWIKLVSKAEKKGERRPQGVTGNTPGSLGEDRRDPRARASRIGGRLAREVDIDDVDPLDEDVDLDVEE